MSKEYLIDTCIVLEILQGNEKTRLWIGELNADDKVMLSGWTILELIKEKRSKVEMENCLKKLLNYKILWPKPEQCDEIPALLISHFSNERDKGGSIKGNAIFDCLIYETAKSNNSPTIVTRDSDFNFIKDVEVLNLQKIPKYKRTDFT